MKNDLNLLSDELKSKSLDKCEIVLQFNDVISAIEELKTKRIAVVSFEPWLVYSDGTKSYFDEIRGMQPYLKSPTEDWSHYAVNSCENAKHILRLMNQEFITSEFNQKYKGTMVYYCLDIKVLNED